MSFAIGPHSFTDQDGERTLANAPGLFDELLARSTEPGATERMEGHRAAALDVAGDADAPLAERVRAVWDGWQAAASALRASGALGPGVEGTVAHLATSDGGVPKTSVDAVEVTWSGVVGDRQAHRQHHGRPWQALCLWSAEVIDAFAAGGDDLAPGRAGENVTVAGIPWARVAPGSLLRLGTVTCEVWAWALPCRHNARWFHDGRFGRMHHREGPVSRAYATVLEPGAIAVGDPAVLL